MSRYASSRSLNATLAHIGHPLTFCGVLFVGPYRVSDDIPADRTLCRRCAGLAVDRGELSDAQAVTLVTRPPASPRGGDELLTLLRQGHTDRAIALRLGLSSRTLSRRIALAMSGVRARSRFEFGYLVGRSDVVESDRQPSRGEADNLGTET